MYYKFNFLSIVAKIKTSGYWRRPLLILIICFLGVFLYIPNLGYPRAIVFDETYLIPNAQSYINSMFFQDSHPPLGRLFIALGQKILHPHDASNEFVDVSKIEEDWPQDNEINGYRLFPAMFGIVNPVLVFLVVLNLTSSDSIALLSAFVLLFDNATITQSRFALPDSGLIAFCLLTILCFIWLQSHVVMAVWKEIVLWMLFGASASAAFMVKFTGLFVLLVLPFYVYGLWLTRARKKTIEFLVVFALAFGVIFVLIWEIHFSLLRTLPRSFNNPISELHVQILEGKYKPNPVERFSIEIQDAYHYMFAYHKNVPALDLSKSDEIGSPWYYWPFGGRTIPYRWEVGSGKIKIVYLVGNPVTWLISLLGVISLSASVVADFFFQFLSIGQRKTFLLFFTLYWGYMFSATTIPRVMYLYHYLPPLIIGILMFGLMIAEIKILSEKLKLVVVFVSLICILLAFQIYRPLTYYWEIPIEQISQLNVLPVWDLRCPNC